MRKKNIILTVIMLLSIMLSGCGTDTQGDKKTEDPLKAILLIPGELGDKSFYDSANNGMKLIEEKFGAKTKVVEMSTDFTKWEPNFLDAIEGDWDLIISGGSATEMMNEIAVQYPDERFINFDASVEGEVENVYSILYGANELSFLAGVCAALVTESDMELANEEPIIGFIGGMDIPGINDFLVGYIEGAQFIDEDIKVIVSYAGSFTDPAKGKELSLIQYKQAADISFNVAGGTGLGVIDAAKEGNKYAIGVDSDQALLFAETDKEKASHIVTSAIKRIDNSILRAVTKYVDGTLEFGTYETLGVTEGGVGLAKNEYYNDLLSDEMKATIENVESKLNEGEITVKSALGMSTEEINEMRNSVKPKNENN
ncbi:BMP family ABC transporter substrate-binding protein [Vallitalea maricola]|uniref:BMP family ABC transporter substrate-binding protein n=1 Tax=Vallitalea maricola TaxID=3074433 RepID=A0ACB5UI94_9FIRM|nr:BMP family ABC transporter substrate-binding protein [Vallitalea sp. AN17-2]